MKPASASLLPPAIRRLNAKALGLPQEREGKADAMAERDLQRMCEHELSRRGIVYIHLPPQVRMKAGWPDLTFAVKGVPCAVELKAQHGKVSDDQAAMLGAMERNGWRCQVIRSYEGFVAWVDGAGRQGGLA